MNADPPSQPVGLTRSALESELRWIMRRVPTDPGELVKFIGQMVITLIDKNNAELARQRGQGDDKLGGP